MTGEWGDEREMVGGRRKTLSNGKRKGREDRRVTENNVRRKKGEKG